MSTYKNKNKCKARELFPFSLAMIKIKYLIDYSPKQCTENACKAIDQSTFIQSFNKHLSSAGLDTMINKKDTLCNFHEMLSPTYVCMCLGTEVGVNQIIY